MNHLQQPRHLSVLSSFSAETEPQLQPDYGIELGPRIIDVFIAALILTLITLTGCTPAISNSQTDNAIPAPAASDRNEVPPPPSPTTVPLSEPEPILPLFQ